MGPACLRVKPKNGLLRAGGSHTVVRGAQQRTTNILGASIGRHWGSPCRTSRTGTTARISSTKITTRSGKAAVRTAGQMGLETRVETEATTT